MTTISLEIGDVDINDAGPAITDVLESLSPGDLLELPIQGEFTVLTGVTIPSGVTVDGRGAIITNNAFITAEGNILWLVKNCQETFVRNMEVRAVATGDFTGGRNPQVAVAYRGVVERCGSRNLDLVDHQNFAIQYGDVTTDPNLARFDLLMLFDITIRGDCGPTGDGAGIDIFPRSQLPDGRAASTRFIARRLNIDVTRGSLSDSQHGPQAMKISNLRYGLVADSQLAGGDSSCLALPNHAQHMVVRDTALRYANRGMNVTGVNSPVTPGITSDIEIKRVTWDQGEVSGEGYGLALGSAVKRLSVIDSPDISNNTVLVN